MKHESEEMSNDENETPELPNEIWGYILDFITEAPDTINASEVSRLFAEKTEEKRNFFFNQFLSEQKALERINNFYISNPSVYGNFLYRVGELLVNKELPLPERLKEALRNFKVDSIIVGSACKSGNFELVKYILDLEDNDPRFISEEAFLNAVLSRNPELINYILDLLGGIDNLSKAAIKQAIWYSYEENIDFVRQLLSVENFTLSMPEDSWFLHDLFKVGDLNFLLNEIPALLNIDFNQFSATKRTLHAACCSGDLEVINYVFNLLNDNPRAITGEMFNKICWSGSLELIEHIFNLSGNNPSIVTKQTFFYACMSGNLDVVNYVFNLLGNDLEIVTEMNFYAACMSGNLDVVNCVFDLLGNNPEIVTKDLFDAICRDTDIDLLTYVFEHLLNNNSDLIGESICSYARAAAKFELLLWLEERIYPQEEEPLLTPGAESTI